jgi:hypothetical protein
VDATVHGCTGSVTGELFVVVPTLQGNEVSGSDGMVMVGMVTWGTVTGGTVTFETMDVGFCAALPLVDACPVLEVVEVESPSDLVGEGNGTDPEPLRCELCVEPVVLVELPP